MELVWDELTRKVKAKQLLVKKKKKTVLTSSFRHTMHIRWSLGSVSETKKKNRGQAKSVRWKKKEKTMCDVNVKPRWISMALGCIAVSLRYVWLSNWAEENMFADAVTNRVYRRNFHCNVVSHAQFLASSAFVWYVSWLDNGLVLH